MTTDTDYVAEQEFLDYYKSNAAPGSETIEVCISASSRAIDAYCNRHFYTVTEARYFSPYPDGPGAYWLLCIDDLSTASGLTVQTDNGAGTYTTTVSSSAYVLEPKNQSQGGLGGPYGAWPYTMLRSTSANVFPIRYYPWQPDTVKVTGTWGWASVPDPIKQACKILTAQFVKMAEAPLGIAGFGSYGDVRVRDIPQVATLLNPYCEGGAYGIA